MSCQGIEWKDAEGEQEFRRRELKQHQDDDEDREKLDDDHQETIPGDTNLMIFLRNGKSLETVFHSILTSIYDFPIINW